MVIVQFISIIGLSWFYLPSPINKCRATTRPQVVKLEFTEEESRLPVPWGYIHNGIHVILGDKYSEGDTVRQVSL